jgi:cytochrome c2
MKKSLSLVLFLTILACFTSCHRNDYAKKIEKCGASDPFKDKMVASSFFTIQPDIDTVIEGDKGTRIVIPRHCFLNADNQPVAAPVKFELAEAYTLKDMLLSGLSTTSDGKLLQTDGMIFIKATAIDQQLHIDPAHPLYIEMPTAHKKPGMLVYKGERDDKGKMNWVSPKKLENYLIPVDLDQLDFLPPGFADTVNKNAIASYQPVTKERTDSLYYSLATMHQDQWINGFNATDYNEPYYNRNAKVVKGKYSKSSYTRIIVAGDTIKDIVDTEMCNGKMIFERYCTSCHKMYDILIGPDLIGVEDRWHNHARLIDFTKNPTKYTYGNDPYVRHLIQQANGALMTVPPLTDKQVEDVISYVNNGSCNGATCGIDPIRIKAIKSKQFQNTLISTREFETRLKYIFKSCDNEILELYVHNLDKNMWQIDSMAANYLHTKDPELAKAFSSFAAQKLTRIDRNTPDMKLLSSYYTRQLSSIRQELEKLNNVQIHKLDKQNKEAAKVAEKYEKLLWKREKYRMEKYGFTWTDLGWTNIDTGTIPKIYSSQQFVVHITNGKQFEHIYTYAVYTSMKSIYRLNTDDKQEFYAGNSDEKKMLIPKNADAVIVCYAYTGSQTYLSILPFNTGNSGDIELQTEARPCSEKEAEEAMGKYDNYSKANRISVDLAYQALFIKEEKRQEHLYQVNEFFRKLWNAALPCCDDRIRSLADTSISLQPKPK